MAIRTAPAPPQARKPPAVEQQKIELPPLPTFPLETGYREALDPVTGKTVQQPLTLLDLLFPGEDDIGVVKLAESPLHDLLTTLLATMLRSYLAAEGWLILRDVLVHWGRRNAPPKGPDLAAILGGRLPAEEQKSYRVGRDGGLPSFVIEVTSEDTRAVDFDDKRLFYAAMGVKEYLIIDLLTRRPSPWQLVGYRLGDQPYYQPMAPDRDGGFRFETVRLRFLGIGRDRVDVFNLATGGRLLTPDEWKANAEAEAARAQVEATRAQAEAARADAEALARARAEARTLELEQRLRAMEARSSGADSSKPGLS